MYDAYIHGVGSRLLDILRPIPHRIAYNCTSTVVRVRIYKYAAGKKIQIYLQVLI